MADWNGDGWDDETGAPSFGGGFDPNDWLNFGAPTMGGFSSFFNFLPGGSGGSSGGGGFDLSSIINAAGGLPGGGGGNSMLPGNPTSTGTATGGSGSVPDWLVTILKQIIPGLAAGTSATATPPFNPNAPASGTAGAGTAAGAGAAGGAAAGTATSQFLNTLLKSMGTGLDIYGGFQGLNQQDWQNAAKVNVLNNLRDLQGGAQGQASYLNGALNPNLLAYMQKAGAGAQDLQSTTAGQYLGALGGVQNAFSPQNILNANQIPGMSGIFDQTGGALGQGNNALGQLMAALPGNLNNPSLQSAMASALGIANGGPQGALATTGNSLLNSQGQNPYLSMLQGAGANSIANGGYTPQLQSIINTAQGLTGTNPYSQLASLRGSQIVGQNPLLPMDQVASMARNQSATDSINSNRSLRKQLINTTGITGPAVAGGGFNDFLGSMSDQALQNQSKAVNDAILGQQGLQLQQFGQGTSLLGLGNSSQLAQQGLGLSSLLGASGQANTNQNSLANLGLGGSNAELSRLLGGGSLLENFAQLGLGGSNAVGNLVGTQNAGVGQNIGALSGLLGSLNNLTGTDLSAILGSANFGAGQTKSMYDTIGSLLGGQSNLAGQMQQGYLGSAALPNQTLNNWINFLQGNGGNQASLFASAPPPTNVFKGL